MSLASVFVLRKLPRSSQGETKRSRYRTSWANGSADHTGIKGQCTAQCCSFQGTLTALCLVLPSLAKGIREKALEVGCWASGLVIQHSTAQTENAREIKRSTRNWICRNERREGQTPRSSIIASSFLCPSLEGGAQLVEPGRSMATPYGQSVAKLKR